MQKLLIYIDWSCLQHEEPIATTDYQHIASHTGKLGQS